MTDMMQFDNFLSNIFFINVTIRECSFAIGTMLGKGFVQAQVHANHSTSAKGTSAVMYARPPNIVLMAKLDISI